VDRASIHLNTKKTSLESGKNLNESIKIPKIELKVENSRSCAGAPEPALEKNGFLTTGPANLRNIL
jgi:hypothetical protein